MNPGFKPHHPTTTCTLHFPRVSLMTIRTWVVTYPLMLIFTSCIKPISQLDGDFPTMITYCVYTYIYADNWQNSIHGWKNVWLNCQNLFSIPFLFFLFIISSVHIFFFISMNLYSPIYSINFVDGTEMFVWFN